MNPKWFGPNWKAPLCLPENHVKTPKTNCFLCEKPIFIGQAGVVLPFGGPPDDPRDEVAIHLQCYLKGLLTYRV
jgi:hypothetical protein